MDKRAAITKVILSAAILFGVAFTTFWLIRQSPSFPIHCPQSADNPYAGLDSGYDAIGLAKAWGSSELGAGSLEHDGSWVRLRGIDLTKVPETRDALLMLRAKGIKTCVFLRLSPPDWKRKYLPDDLHESYEQGHKLGATFGDVVDAWEVDNEPDLGFVPESAERYTSFLKATYLGLKAGAREQRADGGRQPSDVSQQRAPLVLMGSLGLPPGPWLERFAANDGFAYTDGFNYHYYGYADDFTGVYRQHEAAVNRLSVESYQLLGVQTNNPQPITNNLRQKNLPVFLTEIGYGMLGKQARDTKEGRLRQWRWFKSVGEQLATLRPEAPMAFYLPPYLEYDTSEYGLTVPPGGAVKLSDEGSSLLGKSGESWIAGGIEYRAEDFGEVGRDTASAEASREGRIPNAPSDADHGGLRIIRPTPEPWMNLIGTDIGGNQTTPALAQWLAARRDAIKVGRETVSAEASREGRIPNAPSDADHGGLRIIRPTNNPQPTTDNHDGRRAWSVSVPRPSPVVIDFLPGEGLSHIKRYNGLFVTGREPPVHKKPETGNLKPEGTPPKPKIPEPKPEIPIPRSEEFILQIRTQNGNLYEVYPTRQATPDWERFLEPGDNFTMAFYGRAALPWRFKDNKPASLVVVMYPKSLPATYEFRRPQLIKLGAGSTELGVAAKTQVSPRVRYGAGRVVLYNFSDKPATGRLVLPSEVERVDPNALSELTSLTLAPKERREIPVTVKVPWDRYERIPVDITFVPTAENPQLSLPAIGPAPAGAFSSQLSSSSIARFRTDLIPDLASLPATLVASLLDQEVGRVIPNAPSNREIALTRPRASEEAPMTAQGAFFAQEGAQPSLPAIGPATAGAFSAQLSDSFTITVTSIPAGRSQRIEVEIPWPDGLEFPEDGFLSVEFRLRP